MDGFEFNKIAASILIAGLLALAAGKVADGLYSPAGHGESLKVEISESAVAEPEEVEMKVGRLMAAANAENGKVVAKKCVSCHTFESGGADKVGPNLWGILGDSMARNDGFAYSKAMLEFSQTASGWDYDNLFKFLHKPKKYIKGTKMAFVGLKNPSDIADIVAYLRAQSNVKYPLPAVEPEEAPAEEQAETPAAE